jgi:hypothetical protein
MWRTETYEEGQRWSLLLPSCVHPLHKERLYTCAVDQGSRCASNVASGSFPMRTGEGYATIVERKREV